VDKRKSTLLVFMKRRRGLTNTRWKRSAYCPAELYAWSFRLTGAHPVKNIHRIVKGASPSAELLEYEVPWASFSKRERQSVPLSLLWFPSELRQDLVRETTPTCGELPTVGG
jgi:hypothetical protein